jgi:Aspartyl protease
MGGFLIWRTGSTSVSPSLNIHAVTTYITANTILLPIEIKKNEYESVETLALINSGAGEKFINRKYAEQLGLPIQTLERPIMARNVDGTLNKTGTIISYMDLTLKIDGRIMDIQLLVTGLGNQRIILGFPLLNECNLDINWKTGEFK